MLGAKHLSIAKFILVGELVLFLSVPFMLLSAVARRDFFTMISSGRRLLQFAALLLIGLIGVLLYNLGLANAHPIVVAAILNLSPFWAALLALLISKKAIPTSWPTFFGCLAVAFVGAVMIAISQNTDGGSLRANLNLSSLFGSWVYAIPVPILYALSGTLIGKWFADFDDSATLAVTFVTAAAFLIPATFVYAYEHSDLKVEADAIPAIVLLAIGTVTSSALGRVLYQVSLTITDEDNGFVSMFFLIIPAVTAILSLALSPWIEDLRFSLGPMFYAGLAVVAASMFAFSWAAWTRDERS